MTAKQSPDLKGPGLVIPSAQLVSVVEQMEIVLKKLRTVTPHGQSRKDTIPDATRQGGELSAVMCPSEQCKLSSLVVNLDLNIRLHFTLRDNNRHFAAAPKRGNRKMLKLQHL